MYNIYTQTYAYFGWAVVKNRNSTCCANATGLPIQMDNRHIHYTSFCLYGCVVVFLFNLQRRKKVTLIPNQKEKKKAQTLLNDNPVVKSAEHKRMKNKKQKWHFRVKYLKIENAKFNFVIIVIILLLLPFSVLISQWCLWFRNVGFVSGKHNWHNLQLPNWQVSLLREFWRCFYK